MGAKDVAEVRFTTLVWACSRWGHRLQCCELEQLVPAAVDTIAAGWAEGGRGGALRLAEALTRQVGSLLPSAGGLVASRFTEVKSSAHGMFHLIFPPNLCCRLALESVRTTPPPQQLWRAACCRWCAPTLTWLLLAGCTPRWV